MTNETELRDRIWTVIADTLCPGNGGYRLLEYREAAQAIIDELGLTVRGDGCGYHEIHGSYDTRFEN